MTLKLATAATAAPVTLGEAKLHLRVENTDDDDLILALIDAATLEAEHIMGRAVMPQKWQSTLGEFTSSMELQMPPVTAVDSIKYVDATTGTLTTLSSSVYQLVNASDYTASVVLAYGQAWPSVRSQPECVQILFSCGYASAAVVPAPIKHWIKLRLSTLYEYRESVLEGKVVEIDIACSLLDRYRTWLT